MVTIGVSEIGLTFVSSFEDGLIPRLIGGGVAPSESSEATVLGDDRVVPGSKRTLAAVSGLALALNGAPVADRCPRADESLSSASERAEDRAG